MARVAFHVHRRWLEDGHGDLGHGKLLVIRLFRRDDWGVAREAEVNPRIRDKVRLEFRKVHVQRTIEAERGCKGGNDLRDEPVITT